MSPRLRRLQADFEQIRAVFTEHPHIRLEETEGNPPERYQLVFTVEGMVPEGVGQTVTREHRAEIFLPRDYPRRAPICRMSTPVFHPNIDPRKICIGDHWSADQSLAHLIVRIGEMICFQSYNVKSPLNAEAAAWAEQNPERLPLSAVDLSAGL